MSIEAANINVKKYLRTIFDVPNIVTIFGSIFSLCALHIISKEGELALKLVLFFSSMPILIDFIDGHIARRYFPDSPGRAIGGSLDTMTDFLAFGVLPAALTLKSLGNSSALSWFLSLFWLFAAQARLAYFTYLDGKLPSRVFVGLPTPYAAGIFIIIFAYMQDTTASPLSYATIFLLALLMLVPFKFRKPPFFINMTFSLVVLAAGQY